MSETTPKKRWFSLANAATKSPEKLDDQITALKISWTGKKGCRNADETHKGSAHVDELASKKLLANETSKNYTLSPNIQAAPVETKSTTIKLKVDATQESDQYSSMKISNYPDRCMPKALRLRDSILGRVNPMLHFATIAADLQEQTADGFIHSRDVSSSIHRVYSGSHQSQDTDYWIKSDDDISESSITNLDKISETNSQDPDNKNDTTKLDRTVENTTKLDRTLENGEVKTNLSELESMTIEEKLRIVFELPTIEGYKTEFACWLVKTVLLKGYMYITENHLCFYAPLPPTPGLVRKSGYLQKLTRRRPIEVYTTCWFVLKSDGLYIYSDTNNLYYPKTTIYLKNVISVRLETKSPGLRVKTNVKEYQFRADTGQQMIEWIDAINAAVFNANNDGNDVRVVLPFSSISDISITETSFTNDSIKIAAICEESVTPLEYYFSYFNDVQDTQQKLESYLEAHRQKCHEKRTKNPRGRFTNRKTTSKASKTTLFATTQAETLTSKLSLESKISPRLGRESFSSKKNSESPVSLPNLNTPSILEYSEIDTEKRKSWWGYRKSSSEGEEIVDTEIHQKNKLFQSFFALSSNETIAKTFSAYLIKLLPLLGKIYVSNNFVCFKSSLVGFRAKLVVPIQELDTIKNARSYSPFHYALVLTTKNCEEIDLDFHSADSRQKCFELIQELRKIPLIGVSKPQAESSSSLMSNIIHKEIHMKSSFSVNELQIIQPLELSTVSIPANMHITCLTIGTRGDVQPYIALCLELMKDGHTCRIATHEEYREWINGFGIEFACVKGDPAELMQLCVEYGMFTVGFIREALSKFSGWIDELLESCGDACQGTDLLIESPTAMGGVHVAEALQIPYFSAFPMPWTRTRIYPHPFGVAERHMGGTYNYMSYVMIEQVIWKALTPQVNRWRKAKLGLVPLGYALEDKKLPFLYSFSPSVVPPPNDWPDWVHTCGYWFLDNPDHNWSPPESLANWMAEGPPPIYIGFGSIIVADPDELTRIVIESITKAGIRAIVSKGWSSRLTSGSVVETIYPANIYPISSIPHDWLFPRCAGVVHHGGAGTTAAGLRAGKPTLIKPFFGDQYFWAERVQDLGVGLVVKKFTVDQFSSQLLTITTDAKMREKAAFLGETIRSENGVRTAINCIYRDLEFSKTRIKQLADSHIKVAS